MKIVAVIPCLNEEHFIGGVVRLAKEHVNEVIVVDDGSSDQTGNVAEEAGAYVIRHPSSRGAGAATRTGFEVAIKEGADIVVTLDGDGQHDPREIPLLTKPVIEGKADLAIGSRFLAEASVSLYRKFGIDVITFMYNAGHKIKIGDAQSGFRAYSRKAVECINITCRGFAFSIETLVQVRKHGLAIREVPVTCIYHGSGSTEHPVPHGLGVAFSVLYLRLVYEFFSRT